MRSLDELLQASAIKHRHLCPRQVLGVRMGLFAGCLLGLDLPQQDKRLLTIVETDGCMVDGVIAATGCEIGRRTLRVEDMGKVAATFVDVHTEGAVRLVPHPDARHLALEYTPEACNKWQAQLLSYQRIPDEALFRWQWVTLVPPVQVIISRPGVRVTCDVCGEEIINEREVQQNGQTLCRACAGQCYYQLGGEPMLLPVEMLMNSVGG